MITRDNYEEFFLLYVDNELSAADREAVEAFVTANPGLRDEWEAVLETRLSPDNCLGFGDKSSLMKNSQPGIPTPSIDATDYQEYLLSSIDGELDLPHRPLLEKFLRAHPEAQLEMDQLLLTVSKPDPSIVCPDKELLYRKSSGRKAPFLPWMRIAAAAAVLVAIALFFFRPAGRSVTANTIAAQNDSLTKKDSATVTREPAQPLHHIELHTDRPSTDMATSITPRSPATQRKPADDAAPIDNSKDPARYPDQGDSAGRIRVVAVTSKLDPIGPAKGTSPGTGTTEINSRNLPIALNNTLASSGSYGNPEWSREDGRIAPEDAAQKTKMRGLLRKVSRTFTKRVSRIDDDQRTVSIGPFEFTVQ